MPSLASGLQTRDRILEAAHRIFAQKGFRAATVFDIVSAAGTNQASINYHFGSKEKLYREVLRYSFRRMVNLENMAPGSGKGSPKEKLRALVRSMLGALVLDVNWHQANHRLLMWETLMPSGGFEDLVAGEMLPHFKMVMSIVRDLLGPNETEEAIALKSMWLVGACGFFAHTPPVVDAHFPKGKLRSLEELDALADFLTDLSLNGLLNAFPGAWPAIPAG
ncbi:MAG: TetR/AcrR family transcriptional regulator [Rhodospirillales bacterium]|nr:MAG: TetR/AcrR family transcriptional regulator [Rhodospirillales bacterium]